MWLLNIVCKKWRLTQFQNDWTEEFKSKKSFKKIDREVYLVAMATAGYESKNWWTLYSSFNAYYNIMQNGWEKKASKEVNTLIRKTVILVWAG